MFNFQGTASRETREIWTIAVLSLTLASILCLSVL